MKQQKNQQLIRARKLRGLSQEELAEKIGASVTNLSRWERGTTNVSSLYQKRLAEFFEMSLPELGFLDEEMSAQIDNQKSGKVNKPLLINVSFQRNPFFTAHEDILQHLHNEFGKDTSRISLLPQAITGLGGIGKTQIALEYIFRYQHEYQTIIWLTAESRASLTQQCDDIIGTFYKMESTTSDQNTPLDVFKRWLNQQVQWLLIIDNVEEIELINDFLPILRNGHVLLTTRTQITGGIARNIELEKMSKDEGALFLLKRAGKIEDQLDQAQSNDLELAIKISQEMDGLPLALDQAGAYIAEVGCGLSDYFELYQRSHTELLKRRGIPDLGYPESVATTWAISFKKVRQMNRTAIELIHFIAFLPPDAIPETLLRESAPYLTSHLSSIYNMFKLNEAIGTLRRFSLVKRNSENKTFSIHRLVQTVVKDGLSENEQLAWAKRTVKGVNGAFSVGVYIPQAESCAELIKKWGIVSKEAANLLYQAGDHAQQRALFRQAEPLLLQALDLSERIFGGESINVMACLMSLSIIYLERLDFDRAVQQKRRVLEISQKVLGSSQQPGIVTYLLNLEYRYNNYGRYVEAETCDQEILAFKEMLAHDPGLHFTVLYRLAKLYSQQKRWIEAESMCKRALEVSQMYLGVIEENMCSKELADIYIRLEKYEQAEELLEQLVARNQDTQKEGTFAAQCLGSLADAYVCQGNFERAEPLYQKALKLLETSGRLMSGDAIKLLLGYSILLEGLERYEEAALLQERTIKMIEELSQPTLLDKFFDYQRGINEV